MAYAKDIENKRRYNREKLKRYDSDIHRARRRETVTRRRAARLGIPAIKVDFIRIIERDGMWCHICEQDISPKDLSFDHVIPLIPKKGTGRMHGTHTEENMKPAHRVCNTRKSNKLLEEMTPFDRRGPTA